MWATRSFLSRSKWHLSILRLSLISSIFWVKDHALDDPDLPPPPDEVAAEIVESLETALERFRYVAKALGEGPV
jgi:hypothetical protein